MRMMVIATSSRMIGATMMARSPIPPLTSGSRTKFAAMFFTLWGMSNPTKTARMPNARASKSVVSIPLTGLRQLPKGNQRLNWSVVPSPGKLGDPSSICPLMVAPADRCRLAPKRERLPLTTALSLRFTAPPIDTMSPFTVPSMASVPPIRIRSPLILVSLAVVAVPPMISMLPSNVSPDSSLNVLPMTTWSPVNVLPEGGVSSWASTTDGADTTRVRINTSKTTRDFFICFPPF